MRVRDLLILVGLILLILVLTVAEKYAERQRLQRQRQEIASEQDAWRQQAQAAFEKRWQDLSVQLRTSLDSIARSIVAEGVTPESLAVVVEASTPPVQGPRPPPTDNTTDSSTTKSIIDDSLAVKVAREYERALEALPGDLNAYERRVAGNEVASLLQARFGVTSPQFDSLLKHAGKIQ